MEFGKSNTLLHPASHRYKSGWIADMINTSKPCQLPYAHDNLVVFLCNLNGHHATGFNLYQIQICKNVIVSKYVNGDGEYLQNTGKQSNPYCTKKLLRTWPWSQQCVSLFGTAKHGLYTYMNPKELNLF